MLKDEIIRYFETSAQLISESVAAVGCSSIAMAVELLSKAAQNRRAILVCGNGGSASDAMHITGELVGRFLVHRRPIKAICLSSNSAVLTAWANDYEYDTVFSRQVEAYAEDGGVLIGLSTSGNSTNVVSAFKLAKEIGIGTIAMTGKGGGALSKYADVLLAVPSSSTPLIQQVHICLYHFICEHVERRVAVQ